MTLPILGLVLLAAAAHAASARPCSPRATAGAASRPPWRSSSGWSRWRWA